MEESAKVCVASFQRQVEIIVDSRFVNKTFRVEEYKKPEFEVTIDAPKDPVMLGESITARLTAK